MNGYLEEINGNKYLTLVPTNESKEKIKYEKLLIKIRDLIRSITKNLDDYDEKYLKIKFDSDVNLSLNKTIEIPIVTIVVPTFMKIINIIHKFSRLLLLIILYY